MKNTTKIALASLLSAAGSLLNALATEFGEGVQPQVDPELPKPKKQKAAPAAEKPAEQPAPTDEPSVQEPAGEQQTGKTYEELRALIEPLVKGGQGEDVKKVIAKYGANLKEVSTKPQTHAAFEKDLAALSY